LLAGLALFGFGVRALVRTFKPVPFNIQAMGVRGLLANGQYKKAIDAINVLGTYYHQSLEQGELQQLAGDAHYLAQQREPALVPENYKHVIEHYQRAVALGIVPGPVMNERWGEAALALGDVKTALARLEEAIAVDHSLVKVHARELVSAYAATGQLAKAQEILSQMLAPKEGSETGRDRGGDAGIEDLEAVDNRTWALCKQIEIAISASAQGADGGPEAAALDRVVEKAREAVRSIPERDPSGRVLTWIGRAELEQGKIDQAQRDLTEARGHFVARHVDDGRAAVLLARIAESKGDLDAAGNFYREVVMSHAGTPLWAAARFGRAEVAVRQEGEISGQSEGDFRYAIAAVKGSEPSERGVEPAPELISAANVRSGLVADYQRAADAGHLEQALEFLALQEDLGPQDEALVFRTAVTRERRADELLAQAAGAQGTARAEKEAEARALYAQAAEDYQKHSKLTTMTDTISSNSLWKAAQLMDQAGYPLRSIAIYEQFTIQHPRDPRVSEGLLAMGRLYQSAGMIEKAIPVYRRNISENPRTPATYTSAVNLARCYMALLDAEADRNSPAAKEDFDKAEAALLSLVQDNSDIQPAAKEFRASLFTLGELYYRNNRWADAILRLEEAVERYPEDAGMPRALFMLAESFRKSAGEIAAAIQKDPTIAGRDTLEEARADRLLQAAGLFTRVIGILDAESEDAPEPAATRPAGRGLSALEEQYLRTSYMDRAESFFDRGDYAQAIKLYDQTATRFPEELIAVRAYVQIVNAYFALKESTQAGAAAERGRWILKRVPDEAFSAGPVKAGRDYYEKLLSLGKN
jgi:tetratricopeptide (TPR) repeat protein